MAVVDELDPASVCHLFENTLYIVGSSESKSLCCFFFQGKPPPTPSPEGNRKSKLLQVINQKRVRVFDRGVQTPRNR